MRTCVLCGELPYELNQYFIVKDYLWKKFCKENNISESSLVCADCYELRTNKIELDDLTICLVNTKFMRNRH